MCLLVAFHQQSEQLDGFLLWRSGFLQGREVEEGFCVLFKLRIIVNDARCNPSDTRKPACRP